MAAGSTEQARLRIGLADDDAAVRETMERMLVALGHEVIFSATTGLELVGWCKSRQPDLIITDIKMPDMDGLDAARFIYEKRPTPIILLSAYSQKRLIRRAQENHILAYLVKPITQAQLEAAIALAVRRYSEFQTLSKETDDLRQALFERKVIERAKGLLMKRLGVGEMEAFSRLQSLADSKNKKLTEIAETIVSASEMLSR
ncbi:MAG: response regulator [Pirellulales bacterium]